MGKVAADSLSFASFRLFELAVSWFVGAFDDDGRLLLLSERFSSSEDESPDSTKKKQIKLYHSPLYMQKTSNIECFQLLTYHS